MKILRELVRDMIVKVNNVEEGETLEKFRVIMRRILEVNPSYKPLFYKLVMFVNGWKEKYALKGEDFEINWE